MYVGYYPFGMGNWILILQVLLVCLLLSFATAMTVVLGFAEAVSFGLSWDVVYLYFV